MTTFAEAMRKGKPRVLRSLKISEVSSVDSGAGRGVRVLLVKRHKEATMATRLKCSKCGYEGDASEFEAKAVGKSDGSVDFETVHKAVGAVHADIAKRLMAENPTMSLDTAMRKATETPEFSRLHVDERRQRLGY